MSEMEKTATLSLSSSDSEIPSSQPRGDTMTQMMDDAHQQTLTCKEMLMTSQDTRNEMLETPVQLQALQSKEKEEELAQQEDYKEDLIVMLKELGFDYDADVSLHDNPLSDKKGVGCLAQGFREGRRSRQRN